jgi:carboxypeptidase Q
MRSFLLLAALLAAAAPETRADDWRAWDITRDLTSQIGPRMTGSRKGKQAEDFAFRRLKSFGYDNVHFESFPVTAWERGSLTLTVAGQPVAAAALGGTPARADLDRPLVDMGNGGPEDYAAAPDKARGNIALVYAGLLPDTPASVRRQGRWEKVALAAQYGAAGIVLIGTDETIAIGSATKGEARAAIPAVVVAKSDGMKLKAQLAARPAKAGLRMRNRLYAGAARNVVATLPGTDLADEHIIFGGHLDSWDLATGALDNAAGAATVMDVARAFKAQGYRPRRTIQFVLYMGEEEGMLGSHAHAAGLEARGELPKLKYMFNTDMSLDPMAFNLWGFDADQGFYEALAKSVGAARPGFQGKIISRPMPGGDSEPYQLRGVPILYLNGDLTAQHHGCQHAACDRLDILTPAQVNNTSIVSALALKALADADRLPAQVLSGEALAAYKKANGL